MSNNIGRKIKIVKGWKNTYEPECDTTAYEGQIGECVSESVTHPDSDIDVEFSDGITKQVGHPDASEESEWVSDPIPDDEPLTQPEPSVYEQYIEYLDSRITSLQNAHEKWIDKEIGATDQDKMLYSSVAAGIYDCLVEIKNNKSMYIKLHKI